MSAGLVGHVISRTSREDRRRRFLGWNGGHPVTWRWHDAVEPEQVNRDDGALFVAGLDCAAGVAATALSHRRQWLACVEEGGPRLVFEDDACLRRDGAAEIARVMPALQVADLVFLGYNTDSDLMVELPDRLFAKMSFGNQAHRLPGYFDAFAHASRPLFPPVLYRGVLAWGLLGYALSPAGAQKLLRACFPLREVEVDLFAERRRLRGAALDFQVNVALQRGEVTALVCFPPLVAGPNGDSDLDPRKV